MPPAAGHLAAHPLPPGISGALGLGGYQLLAEFAGVGAGRLGPQVFLVAVGDSDPGAPDPGTQLALHCPRVRSEADVTLFTQLAAQAGLLRLSGYRLRLERDGLRSHLDLVDPASGAIAVRIPARHPGRLSLGGAPTASRLLAALRALPPAGAPADPQSPELLAEVLLALALQDDELTGEQAAETAHRALALARADPALSPPAALAAARREG